MHQDATWHAGMPQPRGLCVRRGPIPLPQKGRIPEKFSAHIYCGLTAGWIKRALGIEVGLSPGDFVFDGDPVPSPKRGGATQFSAHVYCGQTSAWIKMALGTEVGVGLRDTVLDGDPAPPPLKGHSPQLSTIVRCGQTAGWTKMPLGMEVGLGSGLRRMCSTGTLQLPPKKRHTHPTQFSAHVYCGQTAGWMKTPVGTEVDLGRGHTVLDVVSAVRESATAALLLLRSAMSATDKLLHTL